MNIQTWNEDNVKNEDFIYSDRYGNAQIDWYKYEVKRQKIIKKIKSHYCLRHQHSYKGKECDFCNHE